MNFSLNEEQMMLQDSVEKFIDNDYDFETRQKIAASDSGFSADVWRTFAELGWTAVPFAEDDGGFDGGAIEIMVIMQLFGRGLVVEPYLANIVLAGGIRGRATNACCAGTVSIALGKSSPEYDPTRKAHREFITTNAPTALCVAKGLAGTGM